MSQTRRLLGLCSWVRRPYEDVILLETMYFADEIRKPESVDGKTQVRGPELDMAKSLVENLSEPFQAEKYDDTYRKELLELLRAKAKTGSVPVSEPEEEEGEVVDLLAALRESVQRTKRGASRRSAPGKRAASGSKRKTSSTRRTARKAS